jgi:hypothetical protein
MPIKTSDLIFLKPKKYSQYFSSNDEPIKVMDVASKSMI